MPRLLLVANVSKEHIRKFHIPFILRMKARGWRVDVACRMDEAVPECDNAYDLPCDRNPRNGGLGKSILLLRQILRENDYDVVLCNTVVGSIIARVAAAPFRKKGLKVIYLNHGIHFFPGAPKLRWVQGYPMEKLLAYQTDVLITINSSDYDTAKKHLRIPVIEQIHGMGVDLSRFKESVLSEEERLHYREKLGIGPDDLVLTYVAEIIDNKNQTMLLDALELIRERIPATKLLLIGPVHDNGALAKVITERNLQDQVMLLGWRDDVPALLHISDIYVASSKSEGLGLNLIEAMACDLPVVASRNRGHAETIENGINGFLVEVNDYKAMAERVLQLRHDRDLCRNMICQARADIEKYEKEATLTELCELVSHHCNAVSL